MPADCSSKPPGITVPGIDQDVICGGAGMWQHPRPGRAANQRLHARWASFDYRKKTHRGRQRCDRSRTRRLVLVFGHSRRLTPPHKRPDEHPLVSASV
jgi:hypothetical protein